MNNYQPLSQQETKEFFDALESLDEKQNLTLYNFSAQLLNGSGYTSGIDLLHEVIDRVLKGSRKWRRDIPFGAFLHEAMRSVAGVEKRSPQSKLMAYQEWMEASANTDDEANNEFACTPEELLMKRQEEQQCRDVINGAKARLAHDKEALAIFSGLAEQMTPAEIRKAYKISESGYKAARARIAMEIRAHITGPLH
jgi:DNA-directed RNA polymerase specialized sigma24 family protein